MRAVDAAYTAGIPAEVAYLQGLKRAGVLLSMQLVDPKAAMEEWRCFLMMRARSVEEVRRFCAGLPLAAYLDFEVVVLDVGKAL